MRTAGLKKGFRRESRRHCGRGRRLRLDDQLIGRRLRFGNLIDREGFADPDELPCLHVETFPVVRQERCVKMRLGQEYGPYEAEAVRPRLDRDLVPLLSIHRYARGGDSPSDLRAPLDMLGMFTTSTDHDRQTGHFLDRRIAEFTDAGVPPITVSSSRLSVA